MVSCRPNHPSQQSTENWHTFSDVLDQLHAEGIYIHPDQLAEFFIRHHLPVSLRHVPAHLKPIATKINANYHGDIARLEDLDESNWEIPRSESATLGRVILGPV